MLKVVLQRQLDDGKRTMGRLSFSGEIFYTIERPWKENKPRVSCIPAGIYTCAPHNWEDSDSFRFKKVWRVEDVPGRSAILLHVANIVTDVIGCIGVGMSIGILHGETAVVNSGIAINQLRDLIGNNKFILEIRNP